MGSSDTPPAQRARTKAPDFSELFRSANGSRQSSHTGTGTGSSPSPSPSLGEKPTGTKAPSRRSILPFLGRKKPAEQTAAPSMPTSRKSVSASAYPIIPVNTVRRSFGNGHAVLMITPSTHSLPQEPPLPPKLPSVDAHAPSLGSKLAAHFTPLRSPAKNIMARHSMIQKPVTRCELIPPPVPSSAALSPQTVPEVRTPSIGSRHSIVRSRSTTPRPLRGPHTDDAPAAENGDEEDFSDLFTLPNQPNRSQQSPNTSSATSAPVYLGDSPKKSGELTPTTPVTPLSPLGPPLQFPIPPSTIAPPRSLLHDNGVYRYSSEISSSSSQGSKSPSRPSTVMVDGRRTRRSGFSSPDSGHRRTTSVSGSDTDTSKANESSHSARSFKLLPVVPKPSSMRKHSASGATKTSSGPPPSVPLPSPPISPNSAVLCPRSAPCAPPNRVVFPRPRANTLSVTSNLVVPCQALPRSNRSSPSRPSRVNSDAAPDATMDELREALSQQRRKNVQLQEYIVTITKRYEDDRMAMTKNIEKLERNVRKKMREIEGLRWLVIHNGAVSDIDAAANLARSSFSTQDGDTLDAVRGTSPLSSSTMAPPRSHGSPFNRSTSGPKDTAIAVTGAISNLETRSDASLSLLSPSVSETSLSTASLSVIPERLDGISRAERQRLKEERRASKALRRISAASSLAFGGSDALNQSPSTDGPLVPNFDPKQGMDEVLERLQPFRHA